MKQRVQEAVGIPKNIHFLAAEIFEYVRYELEERRKMFLPAGRAVTFSKFGDFSLGEEEISGQLPGVVVEYKQGKLQGGEKVALMGMAVANREYKDLKQKTVQIVPGEEFFSITFGGVEEKISFGELGEYLSENKETVTSSIAHELTHFYINRKAVKRGAREEMQYDVVSQLLAQESKIFRNFLYALYLTSPTEIHVRNSEIFTAAHLRGTTKEDFKEFLRENKNYQRIRDLLKFSVEENLLEPIRKLIRERSGESIPEDQVEEHVVQVLDAFYKRFLSLHVEKSVDSLPLSRKVFLFGLDRDVVDFVRHNTKKMKSVDQWLRTSEKQIRQGAEKTLRRIHKVYSELPSREEVGKLHENIIDLDLFCQFYKKPEKGRKIYY